MATQQERDNQNLQNTANQRFEELKPSRHVTGAGETSTSNPKKADQSTSSSNTNVDGVVDSSDRDVETFNASDRNSGSRVGDDRDSRNH